MENSRAKMIVTQMLIILMALFSSCGNDEIGNNNDPSNLTVEISVADDGSGLVQIQATADNAVEYQLRIGIQEEPNASNSTGAFEHTFIQPGTYQIEVRAYGLSGRYIKETRQITIVLHTEVSVDQGYTTPTEYYGYDLIWHDEFEGNSINSNFWTFETGNGCPNLCGWGNNELQYYRQQNAWINTEGVLVIEARNEAYQGSIYTSARMKTQGKFSFKYGRVDIRALLPKGQGIWPALWMLGNNITSVGWPKCGEIDIMEMIGGSGRDNTVHGTVHWDNNGHVHTGESYSLQNGTFADEYHVFSITWNENFITWYVNDTQYYQINTTPSHMTAFHQDYFFIFNVAVGGNWPGNPDATTVFPQQMRVDYIRVFQEK